MAAEDTPGWRIKSAIVDTLKTLNLDGIGANVVGLWADEQSNVGDAAVVVMPAEREGENVDGGDTEHRETQYPFAVAVAKRAGEREHFQEPQVRDWRKRAMDAFFGAAAKAAFKARVPGVSRIDVVPRAVLEIRGYSAAVSLFLLRVYFREPRV